MSTDSIPQKQCSKCKQWFPATDEYFRKAGKEKSGLTARCKTCLKTGDALYRENNPDVAKNWYDSHKEQEQAKRHARYQDPEYRAEVLRRSRQWRDENADRKRANDKAHYEKIRNNPELWSAELLRLAEYRKEHPEARRKTRRESAIRHRGVIRDKQREYYRTHPEKARSKSHKRIAMRKNADGVYTAEDLQRLYEEQEGRCAYCGISIYWEIPKDIHVDHVKALSKGGSNWPDNLCLTCHSCNESKGDLDLLDWMKVRGW